MRATSHPPGGLPNGFWLMLSPKSCPVMSQPSSLLLCITGVRTAVELSSPTCGPDLSVLGEVAPDVCLYMEEVTVISLWHGTVKGE